MTLASVTLRLWNSLAFRMALPTTVVLLSLTVLISDLVPSSGADVSETWPMAEHSSAHYPLTLDTALRPSSISEPLIPSLELEVPTVVVSSDSLQPEKGLCLLSLLLETFHGDLVEPLASSPYSPVDRNAQLPSYSFRKELACPIRYQASNGEVVQMGYFVDPFERFPTTFYALRDADLFPYDRYYTFLIVGVEVRFEGEDAFYFVPALRLANATNQWDVSVAPYEGFARSIKTSDGAEGGITPVYQLTLQRPLSARLWPPILLLILLCFELAVYFVPRDDHAIQILIGLVLGLLGIQSALIPDSIPFMNIMQSTIWLLYVLLAAAAFARFFIRPKLNRRTFTTPSSSQEPTERD